MIKKYLELGENQDGAVAIIVALAMTVFLGLSALAIDVGVLGVSRNELQNAADAAALAGASQLARQDPENFNVDAALIKQAAVNAAGLNKSSNTQVILVANDVALGRWNWDAASFSVAQPYNAVQVTISNHNVNLFFSSDRGMGASAVAIVGPVSGMTGLIPIAVDEVQGQAMIDGGEGFIYEFGQSPGNWGTVDFDDSPGGGTPQIGDWLENGYDGNINIGDEIFTETGVGKIVSGKNRAKVEALIGKKLFIPVIDEFGNGMSKAEVIGFIAIEITEISGKGSKTKIHAEYLANETSGGNVDLGNQSFGVLGVKLAR